MTANQLAIKIQRRVGAAQTTVAVDESATVSVERYAGLVRDGEWEEIGYGADRRTVRGRIWTDAIQRALDERLAVRLPACAGPYYLDAPLVLSSGQALIADPQAEIRLKPQTNTCLIRNRSVVSGQKGPVRHGENADHDLLIAGGIWTTLATADAKESNGNHRGRADARDSCPGAHGVILLHNVRNVVVRNVIIRESRAFGVQIGNASHFLIENVRFERQRRDGIHLEGPLDSGIVRNISGFTADDLIALNAWDWRQYSVTFGPISHVLVAQVKGNAESCSTVRFLPGTKIFPDGRRLACDIRDCVVRDTDDVWVFKMYDQPNGELGRETDYADPIGNVRNVHLRRLTVCSPALKREPALIQVAVNAAGLHVSDVTLRLAAGQRLPAGYKLVQVGPKSMTAKCNPDDPSTWVEVFSPDKDCVVRQLRVSKVNIVRAGRHQPKRSPVPAANRVGVVEQKLNPDYPRTTPRGGTGKGLVL